MHGADATGNESSCKFEVTVALPVALDIRPGACPNPLKIGENGVLPVAILGSSLFDIAASIRPPSGSREWGRCVPRARTSAHLRTVARPVRLHGLQQVEEGWHLPT
jgi:hypothetical protein